MGVVSVFGVSAAHQPTQADGRHVGARARLLPSCFRADFADSLFLASQLGLPGV